MPLRPSSVLPLILIVAILGLVSASAVMVYGAGRLPGGPTVSDGGVFAPVASGNDDHWWAGFGTANQAGLNSEVWAMAVYRGNLVVGGYLTSAGGVAADRIATWNGKSWSALAGGIDDFECPEIECLGVVRALVVHDSSLVVGGNFPSVDRGLQTNYIARWDGERWHPLGSGMNGRVWALTVYRGDLIAGGTFTEAGGRVVNHVARWDGQEWHPVGPGFDRGIHLGGLIVFGDDLIAAGGFQMSGQVAVPNLARWDGSSWGPLGLGVSNSPFALCEFEGKLVVGTVSRAGGEEILGMAAWDGSSWSPFGTPLFATVTDCAEYNGKLVIDGLFTGSLGERISRWTDAGWEALGSGLDDTVAALIVHEGSLFVGGRFLTAGGKPSFRIARWDDIITPVLVQDLKVQSLGDRALITWFLAAGSEDGLLGIHVQRADEIGGPYENRTANPLDAWMSTSFEDRDLVAGRVYWYRLVLLHGKGQTIVGPVQSWLPHSSAAPELDVIFDPGNNKLVEFRYAIHGQGMTVRLGVYDVLGRRLFSMDRGSQEPGTYVVSWDPRNSASAVSNGIYVANLRAGEASIAKKFVIVR